MSGKTLCSDGMCHDLTTDNANCGACSTPGTNDAACPVGEVCAAGACAVGCPVADATCGGVCVDLQSNDANCGSCGNTCTGGWACVRGACRICTEALALPATRPLSVGQSPASVAVGDFNHDGKLDVVVANYSNSVSVLLGAGDGTFGASAPYAVGASPQSVAVRDLDGDGKLDIVTANDGSNTPSVLLGMGDGTFRNYTLYSAGASPHSVALGDLNGDGRPDVVTANSGGASVSVLLNRGLLCGSPL